jgi:hypothetical protein
LTRVPPRRRALDLAIAATANVHQVPLLTRNDKDISRSSTTLSTCAGRRQAAARGEQQDRPHHRQGRSLQIDLPDGAP